jgi:hypothetical protein
MSRNTGIYYLIKENKNTGEIEYFNFESMEFSRIIPKGVALSTLDSLTSLFVDGSEFESFVSKKDINDSNPYEYEIEYKDKRRKQDLYLPVVWNDMRISAMSKLADGYVDYSNWSNYELLFNIVDDIKDNTTGLAKRIASSKKDSTKISDQNKKLVVVIASSRKEVPIADILESFKNYKEFRALYLNYKENDNGLVNLKEMLKRLKIN